MGIVQLAVIIIVIGALLYAANRWIPMQPTVKKILNVVVIGLLILWIVSVIFPSIFHAADVPVPRY